MAYTFKDDGSKLTYYREYNKEVGTGDKTLIGNWVEERALRDAIDTGRYKLWSNPDPDPKAPQETFSKFCVRPDTLDTYRRTLTHGDHVPAGEFKTSNADCDPGYAVYTNPEKGAREQMLEKRARELAQVVPPSQDFPSQLQSTNRQDYTPKDLPDVDTLGRRVMMTQNMVDIKGAGDGLFRKEQDIVARNLVVEATATTSNTTPFYKNSTFTTPITEYLKGGTKD